jgi:hypothetical protein
MFMYSYKHLKIQFQRHRKTESISISKSNLLILLKEIINTYSENHMNHIDAVWEQNGEFS